MTETPAGRGTAPAPRRTGRGVRPAAQDPDDTGFILLESMIAISLISVIMAALGVLFLNVVSSSNHARTRTVAVEVAGTTIESLNSLDSSSLISGRTSTNATAQFATTSATSAPVAAYLMSVTPAVDTDATGTSTPAVPFTSTSTVGLFTFTVDQYLGWCYSVPDVDGSASCVKTPSTGAVRYLRVVVAVSWSAPGCSPTSCTAVSTTLVSATSDPTFKLNQALPPAPRLTNPGDQINAIGDSVSLALLVPDGYGVPPFTWAVKAPTALPAGLTLSPDGVISGTPTTTNGSGVSVTVAVTDAFLREATTTFTWQIVPRLVATTPTTQANTTANSVNLTLGASGGEGAPYTWALASGALPAGLSISNGTTPRIVGQPTTPGTSTFTLSVTDSSGSRSARTGSVSWTVTYPPLASAQGGLANVVGDVVSKQIVATGGSGNYRWSDPTSSLTGFGLSINSAGLVTGTVSGGAKTWAVVVRVTDTTTSSYLDVPFNWTVTTPPPAISMTTLAVAETMTPSAAVTYTCPSGTCTITLTGTVPGVGLNPAQVYDTSKNVGLTGNTTTSLTVTAGSGTVYLNGYVAATAVTGTGVTSAAYGPKVTLSSGGSPLVSDTAAWTAYAMPYLSSPDGQKATTGNNTSQTITYNCTAACSATFVNLPAGVGLNSTTAQGASVPGAASGTFTLSGRVTGPAGTYIVRLDLKQGSITVSSWGIWTVS